MTPTDDNGFLATFLEEALEMLESWEAACLRLEKAPEPETVNALFRAAHNLKGSSRSVGLADFGAFVHKAEDLMTMMKEGKLAPTPAVLAALLDAQALLVRWVHGLTANPAHAEDVAAAIAALQAAKGASEAPPAAAEPPAFGFFDDEPTVAPAKAAPPPPPAPAAAAPKVDDTIRVATARLDALIRIIGEASIQQSIVHHARERGALGTETALAACDLVTKILKDIQREAFSLRLQRLDALFQRLERVARDVARQQGKLVDVVLRGETTELDKTVIERMKDPLVHILRNAVDHGVEGPEARRAKGKPETATITIEAIQHASSVGILIRDDGKGLDAERILRKARERGLVAGDAALSPREVNQLIFLPGFSTAEKVTDISGRGVGMDVVRRAVDELGGSVEIDSAAGLGSTFAIALPSSVGVIDALVVGLGDESYAVPVQEVTEVIDLADQTLHANAKGGLMLRLRDRVVPVDRLGAYLPSHGRPPAEPGRGPRARQPALLTAAAGRPVALAVDAIIGQQSLVIRQLEGSMARVPGFNGAAIFATGQPGLIVDLAYVASRFMERIRSEESAA